MAEAPTWAEMMGRMMAVSFDSAAGMLEWSDPEEEPLGDRGAIRFWFAHPDRWRIEDEDGPFLIKGEDRALLRRASGVMAELSPDHGVGMSHDPRHLIEGRYVAESLSERNDFSRPVGPAVETQVGGRTAWRFVLAPPPHKPAPLEVVLDDATGVVLEFRSQGADYWETLTSFEPDVEVDAEWFVWDGPVDVEWVDERLVHEQRAREVSEHPWPSPTWWPSGMPLDVLDGDIDEGWFVALLGGHWDMARTLARWRPGAPPARLAGHTDRLRFVHRWERDGYQWILATDEEISPDDLQRIINSIPPG